jgi:hypothetical protein
MKKLKHLMYLLVALTSFTVTAQDEEEDDFWGEFWGEVLENYSQDEVDAILEAVNSDDEIVTNLSLAYIDVVTPIHDYGDGFEYVDKLPDGVTQVGFCQGWTANFFYMTQNGETKNTEYIKLWEVGSSKIVTEKGAKYLVVYPVDGMAFEKRTWQGEDGETQYAEVSSIKFYMDWSKQSGLIEQMNNALNVWGTFNTSIRK